MLSIGVFIVDARAGAAAALVEEDYEGQVSRLVLAN